MIDTRTMVDDEFDPRPVTLSAYEATKYRKVAAVRLHTKLPVSDYERDLYVTAGLVPPAD